LAEFANTVSDAGVPNAWAPRMFAYLVGLKQQDVTELRDHVEQLLEDQRRILIVIDDIDRLTADEIRQLFRVVKAVANFPKVIYLLDFGKNVVVKALAGIQGYGDRSLEIRDGMGAAYLEKIVQVSFKLPLPDQEALRSLLAEQLNSLQKDTPDVLFDQDHWSNLYWDGIDHFIDTPRDVVHLINTLLIIYPTVDGEVNPWCEPHFPDSAHSQLLTFRAC
jgi:predicted KAP-like P-loop ATPase